MFTMANIISVATYTIGFSESLLDLLADVIPTWDGKQYQFKATKRLIGKILAHCFTLDKKIKINISTGESFPGMPGVSRNQKLSTEYDFNSFEVSLEVVTEETTK